MDGYFCPIDSVPFGSSLRFAACVGSIIFLRLGATKATAPADLPSEPHKISLPFLLQALFSAMRILDSCTDTSFLLLLAAQKQAGSFRYGQPGRYDTYTMVQVTAWTFALLDLIVVVVICMANIMAGSRGKKRVPLHLCVPMCQLCCSPE